MRFSNKFKIIWWAALMVVLSALAIYRVIVGEFNNFDTLLFVFLFMLFLFPIISEVSFFGINLKKDIENTARELRNEIKSLSIDIKSSNSQQTVVNFNNPSPASPEEYKEKVIEEIYEEKEDNKVITIDSPKSLAMIQSEVGQKTSRNEKVQEKLDNLFKIEGLVANYLKEFYGTRFKSQMKIYDKETNRGLVVDGVIADDDYVREVIEIKYFTSVKSLESFFFSANRFISKIYRIGWRLPVRFIVISNNLDSEAVLTLEKEFNKLNFIRATNRSYPKLKVDLFDLVDGELSVVKKIRHNNIED